MAAYQGPEAVAPEVVTLASRAESAGSAATHPVAQPAAPGPPAPPPPFAYYPPAPPPPARDAPTVSKRASATLLGVATPGIAPVDTSDRDHELSAGDWLERREYEGPEIPPLQELGTTQAAPPAARRPAQLLQRIERPLPSQPPALVSEASLRRRSWVRWLLTAAALVSVAALVAYWLLPRGVPIVLRLRGAGAREELEVACRTCADGTTIELDGVTSSFAEGLATLPLSAPLPVGSNTLRFVLDRPGRKPESLRAPLQVHYRVRPDSSRLGDARPTLSVMVEAAPGVTVTVDGKPVELVGGRGSASVDVADELATLSPLDMLTRDFGFVATTPRGDERGVVRVAIPVTSLALYPPSRRVVTARDSFVLSGKAAKGATVTVAGKPLSVEASGAFTQPVGVSQVGETVVEVRASVAGMAPRIRRLLVRRAASLAEAASELSRRSGVLVGSEALKAGAAGVDKPVALRGQWVAVLAGTEGPSATLALDGCKGDSCRVRVLLPAGSQVQRGELVEVHGRIAEASATGLTVEAELVAPPSNRELEW
jgi:hypothetical protein